MAFTMVLGLGTYFEIMSLLAHLYEAFMAIGKQVFMALKALDVVVMGLMPLNFVTDLIGPSISNTTAFSHVK